MGARTLALVLLLVASGAGSAGAELARGKVLTLDAAKQIVAAAVAKAREVEAPGAAIAVVDSGGNLLVAERLDGTFAAGARISIGKARTAALFQKPTRVFEEVINQGRTAMAGLDDFTPLQGGLPLELDGRVVGGIGVSGAKSAAQDEELAQVGASALASAASSPHTDVRYFDKRRVAAAFAKGDVLFDGAGGRNYMVHASRREKAGQAEVHAEDTDVIYVLDGEATMVTGGEVVDGRDTAPGELRGSAIQGGERLRLTKGDVLIVPNGTPHWFQDVPEPFTYYVVKVRQ